MRRGRSQGEVKHGLGVGRWDLKAFICISFASSAALVCPVLSIALFMGVWVPIRGTQYSSHTDMSLEAGPPEKCSLGISV